MVTNRRSKEWWRKVADRYEARKRYVTLRQFAAEEGVNYETFIKMLYRIRREERERLEACSASGELQFVPVDLVDSGTREGGVGLRMAGAKRDNWLEAETPTGIKVRFSDATCTMYVAELVRRVAGG